MRESAYNLEIDNGGSVLLVNLLSRSVLELDQKSYDLFRNICDQNIVQPAANELEKFIDVLAGGRFICEDDFDEFAYLAERVRKARHDPTELAVVITPTMGCNFSCHYCFENRVDEGMSDDIEDNLISFIEERLRGKSALAVQWFGGEPLRALGKVEGISRRLIELADRHAVNYGAAMVTNGYLLSRDVASLLSNLGIHTVQVTLDGDKHFHDRTRRAESGSSYETIVGNITDAAAYLDIRLRIHVAPYSAHSIKTLLRDIARRGIGNCILEVYFASLFNYKPDGKAHQFEPDGKRFYTTADYAEVVAELYAEALQLGLPVADPLTADFSVCTAVRENAIVVGPSGNLFKCYFELDKADQSVGDVRSGIVSQDRLKKWHAHEIARDDECRSCKFLPVCFGGCTQKWRESAPKETICTHLRFNAPKIFPLFYSAENSTKFQGRTALVPEIES